MLGGKQVAKISPRSLDEIANVAETAVYRCLVRQQSNALSRKPGRKGFKEHFRTESDLFDVTHLSFQPLNQKPNVLIVARCGIPFGFLSKVSISAPISLSTILMGAVSKIPSELRSRNHSPTFSRVAPWPANSATHQSRAGPTLGKRARNLHPAPHLLTTSMEPPYLSINCRQLNNPRPVPNPPLIPMLSVLLE